MTKKKKNYGRLILGKVTSPVPPAPWHNVFIFNVRIIRNLSHVVIVKIKCDHVCKAQYLS